MKNPSATLQNFPEKSILVLKIRESRNGGFWSTLALSWASLIAQLINNLPAIQETPVWFPGRDNLLETGLATHSSILGLPLWLSWWNICMQCRRPGFDPWVGKILWGRESQLTPVSCPGNFHGLYSPWGHKESDRTKQLFTFTSPKYNDCIYWINIGLSPLPPFFFWIQKYISTGHLIHPESGQSEKH